MFHLKQSSSGPMHQLTSACISLFVFVAAHLISSVNVMESEADTDHGVTHQHLGPIDISMLTHLSKQK